MIAPLPIPLPGPPRIEAVLLDAGHTILHVDYGAVSRMAADLGAPVDAARLGAAEQFARDRVEAVVREGRLATDADRWAFAIATLLGEAGVDGRFHGPLIEMIRAHHRAHGLWTIVPDGTREAIAALRARGIKTGVVSNADGLLRKKLDEVGLSPLLDVVIDSHEVGIEKPDPRIFAIALEALGCAAERTVHIGDVYAIDVVGARAAGIAPILYDPARRARGVDCPTIASLSELVA